ncbi:MAG: ribosome-binding factor A [Planctomycetota bacterium]
MPTRRQEKVARIVREVVSDAIANHLNDPRIEGFVSVTRVDMTTDLRGADVYLSIFESEPATAAEDRQARKTDARPGKTFAAILHAKSRIQSLLAARLRSKFCPVLRFHTDEKFKETLETIRLIEQAAGEIDESDSGDHNEN